MRRLLFFLFVALNCASLVHAQQVELRFQLIDQATQAAISDANIFVNNSGLGTASDSEGYFLLNVSTRSTQELIITHLLYETQILSPERYLKLKKGSAISLQAKSVSLNEVVLSTKKNSNWKRNFKKFRKTLLGKGKAAAKCEILNPEVLEFKEIDGGLKATALDLLEIENEFLGYTINFLLEDLSIKKDGSSYYKGYVHFIDNAQTGDNRTINRRDKQYKHSIPHFLTSLLQSTSEADLRGLGYKLYFERYYNGVLEPIDIPVDLNALVEQDSVTGLYRLFFPELLVIEHLGRKVSAEDVVQVSVSSAEQQAFGSSGTQSLGGSVQNAVSRLYKTEPYLLFDARGIIVNKSAVSEYGYWADQRLATSLPIDFKEELRIDSQNLASKQIDTLTVFKNLIGSDRLKKEEALQFLQDSWSESYVPALLDIISLTRDAWQQQKIKVLLNKHVPEINADYYKGIQYLWQAAPKYGTYYANFKAYLYQLLDPAFNGYFSNRENQTKIRLDEVVWGGVRQDGIPPLILPTMITVGQDSYLSDTDVVFGVVVNGEARAYPKRILAWHELLNDNIGDRSITVVYCTLCGTVIVYDNQFEGTTHTLGTSGFLYRSNKLMYDKTTQSLWSTFLGEPVVGPLVGKNIQLSTLPIETTNWGEWRKRHPNTKVLSLETGHTRNYDEGEAYKDYFSHDNLMFPVARLDERLPNKARVFIPRAANYEQQPLAISVAYLKRKGIYQDQIAGQNIVIVTEPNGASRAYAIHQEQFKSYKKGILKDSKDQEWQITQEALIGPKGNRLLRLPAHESFWFAWINVFPDTRIVY